MLIIGERINGMYKLVGQAIAKGDGGFIRELATEQTKAGAGALDVCVGPVKGDPVKYMEWLVEQVQSVTDVPLCIDSPHPEVIKAGVEKTRGRTLINSMKLVPEQMEVLIPLAAERDSGLICLLMDEKGIPADSTGKLEIAAQILAYTADEGISQDQLYFDPILLPVANAQKDVAQTFELMDQLSMLISPAPHMVVGLSNLSQRARYRSLLNRTYVTMAMSHGLDTAIVDPMDEKLVKAIKTGEILLNQKLYARSYLKS